MSNLTLSIDDDIIKQARVRAIQEGVSVSAKVREFLIQYAHSGTLAKPIEPVRLPVFDGGCGLQPGIDPRSNKSLLQAAEESPQ